MAELGKIDKPDVESFEGKKKLYFVRNLYIMKNSPEDYTKLFHTYWDEVDRQVEKMEAAGKITKVFCETLISHNEGALEKLSTMNERVVQLIKKKMSTGVSLLPLEKEELFDPFLDWSNCLMVVRSREVFDRISQFYSEALQRRFDHILEVIKGNLDEGESGLLIMRDEDRVKLQFPKDIELFLVTPPSYDDILRWVRHQLEGEKVSDDSDRQGPGE